MDETKEGEVMATPEGRRIITHMDQEMFDLLKFNSRPCSIPCSAEDIEVIGDMIDKLDSMRDEALAIAAVQMGYSRRIFVMRQSDGTIKEYINPSIVYSSRETSNKAEGCLSLPGFFARVKRPKTVRVKFLDKMGIEHEQELKGVLSRTVCHEMDHLNGILLSSHLEKTYEKQLQKSKVRSEAKKKKKEASRRKRKNRR